MTKLIGFVGKGGTGKSTVTSLFLKYILQKNIKPVLVVDADPNNCLNELLSLETGTTVGKVREELKNQSSISKYDYCEYALNNSIIESTGYDLVIMGRSDGPGCYCYVNHIVKTMIEKLKRNYKLIIVDCEAGLEHLSRKTLGDINIAFVISDFSRKGILTGIRQIDLMKELKIKTDKNYLIINNVYEDKNLEDLLNMLNHTDMEYAGTIHNDENISTYERNQKSFLNLPDNVSAYQDLKNILDKIDLF